MSATPIDIGQSEPRHIDAVAVPAATDAAPLMLRSLTKRWRKDLPLVLDGLDLTLEPGHGNMGRGTQRRRQDDDAADRRRPDRARHAAGSRSGA